MTEGADFVLADNLTLPTGTIEPTRQLVSAFLKNASREYAQSVKSVCPPHLYPVAKETIPILKSLGQRGMFHLIRRPQLHVFLSCAQRELRAGNAAMAGLYVEKLLFQTLFELSLDRALPERGVLWPGPPPLLNCLSPTSMTHIALTGREAQVLFTSEGLRHGEVELKPNVAQSDGAKVFHSVQRAMKLSLRDGNPLSDFEAHPDKDGNQVSLGQASTDEWVHSLNEALSVIHAQLPLLKEEMDLILQQFVPVGYDSEQHLSASYMESIGTVYLTLHPRNLTMTEAVIHEFQHNKINMLFHLDAVLHNAYSPLFTSPIRPDPRPLHGLLLAAHAFVPVAELYRRCEQSNHPFAQDPGFKNRFHQIVQKNTDAINVLEASGKPTAMGQIVIEQLSALNETHRNYLARA